MTSAASARDAALTAASRRVTETGSPVRLGLATERMDFVQAARFDGRVGYIRLSSRDGVPRPARKAASKALDFAVAEDLSRAQDIVDACDRELRRVASTKDGVDHAAAGDAVLCGHDPT